MNVAFLPDLSALTILVIILFLLRRLHRHEQADLWLLGLFLTLIEATAHTFYARDGLPAKALHVIVLLCYLLAGIVFLWAAGAQGSARWRRLFYLALNAAPLLVINILYGLHVAQRGAYFPAVAAGLVLTGVTAIYFKRSWMTAILQMLGWIAVGVLIHNGKYRESVYWSLCVVYSLSAVNFYKLLPSRSTGRLAIVTGFTIWAACFFIHPFIVSHRDYADIASHIWNMQKSLISIGMILVMLEEQVTNNRWLALHDELTGLANRRSFEDQLQTSLERIRRTDSTLAVFLLDLNGFKLINDTLGHHAGDEFLREVARRLREDLRGFDLHARLGGDEFTLIACDLVGIEAVDYLSANIEEVIARPIQFDDRSMSVTASLGIAIYPRDAHDAARLVRIADQRMYACKQKPPRSAVSSELPSSPSPLQQRGTAFS